MRSRVGTLISTEGPAPTRGVPELHRRADRQTAAAFLQHGGERAGTVADILDPVTCPSFGLSWRGVQEEAEFAGHTQEQQKH